MNQVNNNKSYYFLYQEISFPFDLLGVQLTEDAFLAYFFSYPMLFGFDGGMLKTLVR
jgi:hypothetical protein